MVSINIITLNGNTAPANIERAMCSVRSFAGEFVIVLDNATKDATERIIKRLCDQWHIPLVLIRNTWRDDFSQARNLALKASSGDWIFWLDDDDEVLRTTAARIPELIQREPMMWWFGIIGPGISQIGPQARLLPKCPSVEWRHRVHENPHEQYVEEGGRVGEANLMIYHWGYACEVKLRRSMERNIRITKSENSDPEGEGRTRTTGSNIIYVGTQLYADELNQSP